MKLEGTIYCEGSDCDSHHHLGITRFDDCGSLVSLPPGFTRVSSYNEKGEYQMVFCGLDCLMKWAATFPPSERISFDDREGQADG